jgi:RNA polymerase sigma factor (sigma-70 family)
MLDRYQVPKSHDVPTELETTPMIQVGSQDWIERLRRCDSQVWEIVLRSYATELRRDIGISLKKRSLPDEWTDDVEQETWCTAVRKIDTFVWQGESEFYKWLRSIARHHVQTLRYKTKAHTSWEAMDEGPDDTLPLDLFLYVNGLFDDSPEIEISLRETMAALDGALRRLKPREREILLRRLVWRDTPQSMAVDYGVKPETISVILSRAKEFIRIHLAAMEFFRQKEA